MARSDRLYDLEKSIALGERVGRLISAMDSLLLAMLKIDDVRDINGKVVAQRIVRTEQFGIPFHAIFDASGTLLIDSNGPLGNIGTPGGTEGKKHLKSMLTKTRRNLSDAEVDNLVESTSK